MQALYKSATDESAHLMHELTIAAESARRTAVKLRGRETGGWVAGWVGGWLAGWVGGWVALQAGQPACASEGLCCLAGLDSLLRTELWSTLRCDALLFLY